MLTFFLKCSLSVLVYLSVSSFQGRDMHGRYEGHLMGSCVPVVYVPVPAVYMYPVYLYQLCTCTFCTDTSCVPVPSLSVPAVYLYPLYMYQLCTYTLWTYTGCVPVPSVPVPAVYLYPLYQVRPLCPKTIGRVPRHSDIELQQHSTLSSVIHISLMR